MNSTKFAGIIGGQIWASSSCKGLVGCVSIRWSWCMMQRFVCVVIYYLFIYFWGLCLCAQMQRRENDVQSFEKLRQVFCCTVYMFLRSRTFWCFVVRVELIFGLISFSLHEIVLLVGSGSLCYWAILGAHTAYSTGRILSIQLSLDCAQYSSMFCLSGICVSV